MFGNAELSVKIFFIANLLYKLASVDIISIIIFLEISQPPKNMHTTFFIVEMSNKQTTDTFEHCYVSY